MAYDAMSTHQSGILSMTAFKKVIDTVPDVNALARQSEPLFSAFSTLPTLKQSTDFLVDEAMKRAKGNQSLAARLLGISQPALSKRLKKLSAEE